MPICPRCSATIHAGAEDQCPTCGYSLQRANAIFGEGQREFTRVLDDAGALTHPERMELLHALENMERRLSPVALCIYITDDGNVQDLRTHAHWILNHARIHHPSFGKREQKLYMEMLEASELRERAQGEAPVSSPLAEPTPSIFSRLWTSISAKVSDLFHPYAEPVRQEWMLILVVDVQLEMACFSWGYMLDPYINPDSINSCIVNARLQFREREMVSGLKKVMSSAVSRIAADAHKANRRIRRRMPQALRALLLPVLALGLLTAPAEAAAKSTAKSTAKPAVKTSAKTTSKTPAKNTAKTTPKASTKAAAKSAATTNKTAPKKTSAAKPAEKVTPKKTAVTPTKKPETNKTAPKKTEPDKTAAKKTETSEKEAPKPATALADDDVAEEVDDDTAEEVSPEESTPQPSAEKPAESAPAAEPEGDNAASFNGAPRWKRDHYRLLMAGELETGYAALFPNTVATASAKGTVPKPAKTDSKAKGGGESDTTVQGRYCDEYLHPDTNLTLLDPQRLLSSVETDDVEHVLNQLNANSRFRLCVAVFKGSQNIPGELSADTLVSAVAQQTCDYAVLLLYPIGQPDKIDIGYREIKVDDAKRHEWLTAVRRAAAAAGDGTDGILSCLQRIHGFIEPLSRDFKPITPDAAKSQPLIDIQYTNQEEKEESTREKMQKLLTELFSSAYALLLLIPAVPLAAFAVWFFFLRRHSATLYATQPDMRLASPYGAGVSRYVKYLEGKEAGKEKSLF